MELHVTRWKRYGHDRLYANLPDGTAVGWADVRTGDITVLVAEYRDDVSTVLTHTYGTTPSRSRRRGDPRSKRARCCRL